MEEPSIHLIPLSMNKQPVIFGGSQLPAITTNGRVSLLPFGTEIIVPILKRVAQKYPHDKDANGARLKQYLCVGTAFYIKDKVAFIFDVLGYQTPIKESDHLLLCLYSLGGLKVGSAQWNNITAVLSQPPIREWVNESLFILRDQLNWTDYVKRRLADYGA